MQYALYQTPLFPPEVLQKGMLYYQPNLAITLPVSGLAATPYLFSANGMFDPDITGTGHQPMGFDQMMSLYNQCCVIRSKITVCFIPTWDCRFGVYLSPDTAGITDPIRLMENGLITTHAKTGVSTMTGVEATPLTLPCDVRKYFGRRTAREMQDDVNLQTTAATNPTEGVYFAINGWFSHDNPGATKVLYFDILIEYDAIFWEPKKQSVSITERKVETGPSTRR